MQIEHLVKSKDVNSFERDLKYHNNTFSLPKG